MMVIIKLLVVVMACVSSVNTRAATGWCCPEREDGGGGCPAGAATGHFQPPIYGTEENDTVTWKTRAVTCPPSSTLVYHSNSTDYYNEFTLLDQDELELLHVPNVLFDKFTEDYCLEGDAEGQYRIGTCKPDPEKICGGGVCIPKCCGEGEVIENGFECRKRNKSSPLQFYSIYGEPIPEPRNFAVVGDGIPDCEAKGGFVSPITESFHLLVNGKLLDSDNHYFYDTDEYCIENSYDEEGNGSVIAYGCRTKQSYAIHIKHQMMKVGYVISAVFLIITITVHLLIPILRDTQGLILLSHMVSMLVVVTVLFMLAIFSRSMSSAYCVFNGFVFQFFFLAMFFWLNIMCFDIWRVIRATARGIPLLGILSSDAKKFKLYCLYGWGSPLVITIVTTIMHFLPDDLAVGITRPGFGTLTCWLPGDLEHLIYCYAYVAVLFILDLLFIGHTMVILYQAGNAFTCFARQVTVTAFNRKHLEAFWQRFFVFASMVLCWTAEILSWKIHPQEIWIITDFINSSQGFVIFLIFISNKKRRDMIKELLKKVSKTYCPRLHRAVQSSSNNEMATWNASSPSASISGPSGLTEEECTSKTEREESD